MAIFDLNKKLINIVLSDSDFFSMFRRDGVSVVGLGWNRVREPNNLSSNPAGRRRVNKRSQAVTSSRPSFVSLNFKIKMGTGLVVQQHSNCC